MHLVVELSVNSTAKESLTKLDGALRERRNVVTGGTEITPRSMQILMFVGDGPKSNSLAR
jgi:hypothetical protein